MATTYELIASQTLSGTATAITFSSLPQTFDDLIVTFSGRGDTAAVSVSCFLALNGSTANMTRRVLYGDGSGAGSVSTSTSIFGDACGATSTSNTFSSAQIYIPNYTGSTNKSWSSTSAYENNATTAVIHAVAGLWSVTSAITSVGINCGTGNLVSGTSAQIYGVTHA